MSMVLTHLNSSRDTRTAVVLPEMFGFIVLSIHDRRHTVILFSLNFFEVRGASFAALIYRAQ